MSTYLIYNFILFSSLFSAHLYKKSRAKEIKLIAYSMAFLIPFFFLAIRYNIGNDYPNYVKYFHKIVNNEIVLKEPGYIFLNYIIGYLNLDVQWLFVLFGFFYLWFSYKALPKEGFAFGIFLLITISYLYEGFSAIRQGLAIAILTYALHNIEKSSFLKYFVWIAIASLFHLITAFLFLVSYPLVKIKLNKFISILIILGLFFVIQFTNIAGTVFSLAASIFPKYAWYLNNMEYAGVAKTSMGLLGPIIKILIILPIFYYQDKIIKKFPKSQVMINFSLLYIISYIFHLKISIFGRVEHSFVLVYIITMVYFVYTFHKYSRVFMVFFIGLFYYLMFMRYIINGTLEVDNDVYINPYQTIIFDRNGEK